MNLFKYIETGYEIGDKKILLIQAETIEEAKNILIQKNVYDKYNGELLKVEFDFYGMDEIL